MLEREAALLAAEGEPRHLLAARGAEQGAVLDEAPRGRACEWSGGSRNQGWVLVSRGLLVSEENQGKVR